MTITVAEVATSIGWAAVGAVGVWLLTWPLRRRSGAGLLLSVALTCAAASAGAMLGAVHSMLLPMDDEVVALVLAAVAGVLTAAVALFAARRVGREHSAVADAIDRLARGDLRADERPRLRGDLEALRTRLHRTAAALAASSERERALESSRRELVTWISHDLRTPLAGLRAMAEALEDGVPEQPETYYKQIGVTVDRLNGMVEDLFDLSRIQAGGQAKAAESLSIGVVVRDAVAALTPLATAGGVRLDPTSTPDLIVDGSAAELTRAVTNVIANAIRHTCPDGAVAVSVAQSAPDTAEIAVRDQCGGIEETVLPRVFDVGFRGDAARTPDSARAGLGLAITKGIVEAHGGDVTVGNVTVGNVDQGCRFVLTLPLTGAG